MAQQQIRLLSKEFQPAAVGVAETKALFSVKKGDRVLWQSVMPLIAAAAATTSTVSVGDGAAVAGYMAATDTEWTAGTPIDGEGTYLAQSGGKLYTADDTVDVDYVPGVTPGATNPKCRVTISVVREYPA